MQSNTFTIPGKLAASTDFTYEAYETLLRELRKNGYSFEPFPRAKELLRQQQRFVLMRHDVDFDLGRALKLAEIEENLGVSSTYFFIIRTGHYNIFSSEGTKQVSRILDLGHHLGLHFDCSSYPLITDVHSFNEACTKEVQMLEQWFGKPVSIVSYHRPDKIVLSGDPCLSYPIEHTYMSLFTKEIVYLSDSRGEWKFGYPTKSQAFRQGKPLHILVHPIWWNERPVNPYESLLDYLGRSDMMLEKSVARNCSVYKVKA